MMKTYLVSLAFLLIVLMACSAFPAANEPLEGTNWELYAYRKTRPIEGTTLTIVFEDGQIRGSAGCNL